MNAPRFQPAGQSRREALLFTRESMRAVDAACIEQYGIPGIVLMENAAAALASAALKLLADAPPNPRVLICCGPGNNGGDGFALARRLHNESAHCSVMCSKPPGDYSSDAAANLKTIRAMNLDISELGPDPVASLDHAAQDRGAPHLVVDALFGTGLDRPVKAPLDAAIRWINNAAENASVLAVDVPSGLDADTGRPLADNDNAAVRATATVTLGGMKTGLAQPHASRWTGAVTIGDIGAPLELLERLGTRR